MLLLLLLHRDVILRHHAVLSFFNHWFRYYSICDFASSDRLFCSEKSWFLFSHTSESAQRTHGQHYEDIAQAPKYYANFADLNSVCNMIFRPFHVKQLRPEPFWNGLHLVLAFATWQNKSIIIVCSWNIVNFHQSLVEKKHHTHTHVIPFVLFKQCSVAHFQRIANL